MNRLWLRKNDPLKISSKFRKRPGSLSIVSLNNNNKEEVLEHKAIPGNELNSKEKTLGQSDD